MLFMRTLLLPSSIMRSLRRRWIRNAEVGHEIDTESEK